MADDAIRTARRLREPMRSEMLELAEKWRRLAEIAEERDRARCDEQSASNCNEDEPDD